MSGLAAMAKIVVGRSILIIALIALVTYGWIDRAGPVYWSVLGMFVTLFGWDLFWGELKFLKPRDSEKPPSLAEKLILRFTGWLIFFCFGCGTIGGIQTMIGHHGANLFWDSLCILAGGWLALGGLWLGLGKHRASDNNSDR